MSEIEEGKEGKAKVRELLIQRVAEAGLTRAKGMSIEAHEAYTKRLAEQLAYMSGENLMTLAELVIENGQGPMKTIWPAEVIVMNFARSLQRPPPAQRRIITSWLASVEGPIAEAGGYLVELYRFLDQHGRPPMQMDNRLMRDAARDNRRRVELIEERIERGAATEDDLGWLERYRSDQRAARQIVEEGAQRRDHKSKDGAAA